MGICLNVFPKLSEFTVRPPNTPSEKDLKYPCWKMTFVKCSLSELDKNENLCEAFSPVIRFWAPTLSRLVRFLPLEQDGFSNMRMFHKTVNLGLSHQTDYVKAL